MSYKGLPFNPLVALEKQHRPNAQTNVLIRFNKPAREPIAKEQIEAEEGEVVEERETAPRTVAKIVDKRKTSAVNRGLILEKLKQNGVFLVQGISESRAIEKPALITTEEQTQFIIKKKRLVIRPPMQIKAPDIHVVQVDLPEAAVPEIEEVREIPERGMVEEVDREIPAAVAEVTEVIAVEPEAPIKKPRGRKPKGAAQSDLAELVRKVDLTTAVIRTQTVADRLPKEREKVIIKAPTYYMNNRKLFIQKLIETFAPYRQEILSNETSVSCDSRSQSTDFDLLTHQKIVRDYLNIYTPYRGLLLYHGLGSGKTCTSIAIAEGMKSERRVFIMTPASLKMNFFSEMKKCGDQLYKKNQYWEFISIDGKPDYVPVLAKALSLSVDYIQKASGAWLVNVKQPKSNYTDLHTEEQESLDEQLDEMIRSKYTDINYNGLNMNKIKLLTSDFTINPFDNAVVVIDEAHNFVSRIVNKIKKPKTISYILYDLLMNASNARIVLLTGTPIINYPNEIGVLYNILRGYIKTWSITVNVATTQKITTDTILDMFDAAKLNTYDYVDYTGNKLTITRNPFGFVNAKKSGALKGATRGARGITTGGGGKGSGRRKTKNVRKTSAKATTKKHHAPAIVIDTMPDDDYPNKVAEKIEYEEVEVEPEAIIRSGITENLYKGGAGDVFNRYNGVRLNDSGNITDTQFQDTVLRILRNNGIEIQKEIVIKKYKSLPDESDSFLNTFVDTDTGVVKNINLFQRRILGLTSYFRSAQEQLLPRYEKTEDGDIYHVVKSNMSEHQFGIYEKIRKEEADREKSAKKRKQGKAGGAEGEDLFTISSTYRIFSRAACNFTFPSSIERPVPSVRPDKDINENIFDAVTIEQKKRDDTIAVEDEDDIILDPNAEAGAGVAEVEPDQSDAELQSYAKRIEQAMIDVNAVREGTNESEFLSKEALPMFSPKFAQVLENLVDPTNEGLHLLYSHFRTIEGIGILRLVLLANGFAEFKIRKVEDVWEIIEEEADSGKPRFVLYTGTETVEEKEIIRNVYNGAWDFVPVSIANRLREKAENNIMGEVIKILMITSSGAEGINLKNTRYVHIIEPYWHMVRTEQVVGRARRICSHQELPEAMRTVKVFLYVSTLSEEQRVDEKHVELRIRDVSRLDGKTPITTDELLYEIASTKQRINTQILKAIKETAIDCNLYPSSPDEPLVCYGFGKIQSNQFSSYPAFEKDRDQKEGLDLRTTTWRARLVKIGDVEYALNEDSMELYDLESYNRAVRTGTSEPIKIGMLANRQGRYVIERS